MMSKRLSMMAVGGAAVLIWAAAALSQDPLPAGDVKALIKHDAEEIQKAFAKKFTKNNEKRAKTEALLIAAYAQEQLKGKDAAQMATIRNRAVAILAAAGFGTTAQTLQSLASLQDSSPRLS